jgi:hypothetical protein
MPTALKDPYFSMAILDHGPTSGLDEQLRATEEQR